MSRWRLQQLFSSRGAFAQEVSQLRGQCVEIEAIVQALGDTCQPATRLEEQESTVAQFSARVSRAQAYGDLSALVGRDVAHAERQTLEVCEANADEFFDLLAARNAANEARDVTASVLQQTSRAQRPHRNLEVENHLTRSYAVSAAFEGALTDVREAATAKQRTSGRSLFSMLEGQDAGARTRAFAAIHDRLKLVYGELARHYSEYAFEAAAVDALGGSGHPMQGVAANAGVPAALLEVGLAQTMRHRDLFSDWIQLKCALLELEPPLSVEHIRAPLGAGVALTSRRALSLAVATMSSIARSLGDVTTDLVQNGCFDDEVRRGRANGSFCYPGGLLHPSFVLHTPLGTIRDAVTLAHEFMHAVHFQFAYSAEASLAKDPPLALAEAVAACSELALLRLVQTRFGDSDVRVAISSSILDNFITGLFRAACVTQFETSVADACHSGLLPLGTEYLSDVWLRVNRTTYGESVSFPAGFEATWCLIPGIGSRRFYFATYIFGYPAALVLHELWEQSPVEFAAELIDVLTDGKGVTAWEAIARFGVTSPADLYDRAFARLAVLLTDLFPACPSRRPVSAVDEVTP